MSKLCWIQLLHLLLTRIPETRMTAAAKEIVTANARMNDAGIAIGIAGIVRVALTGAVRAVARDERTRTAMK